MSMFEHLVGFGPYGSAYEETGLAQQRASEQNQRIAAENANLFMHLPRRELAAGIFWERTGGKTYRVTIRRKPEVVIDLSGLLDTQFGPKP
jgi:hypothetical protein